ncbi:PD-(D/E)XK nuclease family protein [Ravibacter arvi]|uniref:PD-(D/E)XK nuclease family protein n=1 Tax=Ravibacter arvi TaxID=2051041 RepID=A0ABP8LVG1_9BACT
MESFLKKVVRTILENHGSDLSDIQVVVPTRRAVFFLKRELGKAVEAPMLSPAIAAVEDFVEQVSGLLITDPVSLLFTLFEAFREVDTQVDFNRFMGWGSVLLADFDRIDMSMVASDKLFEYLTEAKALERWNFESGERNVVLTPGTRHFFSLFENIRKVYTVFRARLEQSGVAYPGMAYRYLAEHPSMLDAAGTKKYYFAGFNAFTASEFNIIGHLSRAGKAELLWDSDAYYMEANTYLEAGRYMRRMKEGRIFGPEWSWMGDDLLRAPKTINVYGVANATLQTRVAGQIYRSLREQGKAQGTTAIVLADETLLTPMLYALDAEVSEVNVTMGLPMKNSMMYTLVDALFELQEHLAVQPPGPKRIHHRYLVKLLSHPFLRQYGKVQLTDPDNDFVTGLISLIRTENKVFLSEGEIRRLTGNDFLIDSLLKPWPHRNAAGVLEALYEVIRLFRTVYQAPVNPVELEYLYSFYTLLGKFGQTIRAQNGAFDLQTVRQLLFEQMRQSRIPFSGEPVSSLQIIGLLETRALDFETVIILSVNEGLLPARKKQNSLIPFDIAREAGLPTHEHQEALSAYYFYRLLQRSEEVHLLYVNTQDAMGGGEKSRLLLQLEHEWPRFNPEVTIKKHGVGFSGTTPDTKPQVLLKDDVTRQHLLAYLKKGMYPTHIHTLLNSPLDFYLKHVLRFEEEKETEETLGMDKLGSWLHDSFEALDHAYFLKQKEPDFIQVQQVLEQAYRKLGGYETATGLNSLYFKVGTQQFWTFMQEQHLKAGHRWPVATEQNLSATFGCRVGETIVPVRIGGKIDRVELAEDGTLYVMDYKTGSVDVKSRNVLNADIEKFLTTDTDYKMNYVRQLWLYQYLVYREMSKPEGWEIGGRIFRTEDHQVRSGFYSLRSPKKVTENPLDISPDPATYMAETERILGLIIGRMLDEEVPFGRGEV